MRLGGAIPQEGGSLMQYDWCPCLMTAMWSHVKTRTHEECHVVTEAETEVL